ncbi:MAG: aminotransferase class V-fold PLP-dependent enzyme [Clostridia bacterium]|nr:aminotransferase class V-fold PLP-dependent enzyme [Clostridia bacterium]
MHQTSELKNNALPTDEEALRNTLADLEAEIDRLERKKMELGRLADAITLKKAGFTDAEIDAFCREDEEYVKTVEESYQKNLRRRNYMFGYPANLEDDSYATQYLRHLESKMFLMNNCGDPYQRGNYRMDSKAIEKKIIALVAENLGVAQNSYWGYITSGGTESNFWGVREGFNHFPAGKLYFSDQTHYSVEKYVFDGENQRYPYEKIPTDEVGRIDADALLSKIEQDRARGVKGAILVLTWGTTCRGAIDPVKDITARLQEKQIPYYCHLDAALYGGIARHQKNAPFVRDLTSLGVDSIAVSMHKFMGTSRVNGVVLALQRKNRHVVDYIGQEDSTLLGSRDYHPFSTYQRAREMLLRRSDGHYEQNILFFEEGLRARGIAYERFEDANIFVIDQPSDGICKKYQLATFLDAQGRDRAHIIIFPHHKKSVMEELLCDLAEQA